ncbi:MAG: TMEM165/GDT1 family protein [Candidatus Bipolaricaulota bacterium]|nr:TMEM165/GDT1 family protein [Candidatus Bipolaricaulota bacterium]MDW8127055.1 TMEM165/GDT1 family protein [Candidatus Bipolaricaulota bacterium]
MDWRLVLSTFGLLFLAELGDKTQLAVFALAAQHRAPWPVFLGAALALSLVSLLGAFLGGWLGCYLPTKYVELGAGLLFLGVGAYVVARALAM